MRQNETDSHEIRCRRAFRRLKYTTFVVFDLGYMVDNITVQNKSEGVFRLAAEPWADCGAAGSPACEPGCCLTVLVGRRDARITNRTESPLPFGGFAKLAQNRFLFRFFGHFLHRIAAFVFTIRRVSLFATLEKLRGKQGFPLLGVERVWKTEGGQEIGMIGPFCAAPGPTTAMGDGGRPDVRDRRVRGANRTGNGGLRTESNP